MKKSKNSICDPGSQFSRTSLLCTGNWHGIEISQQKKGEKENWKNKLIQLFLHHTEFFKIFCLDVR